MSDTVTIEFTIIGRVTVSRDSYSPDDGAEMSDEQILDYERYNVDTLYEVSEIVELFDSEPQVSLELVDA